MKTLVTRKREESGPHRQYDREENEISLKWSEVTPSFPTVLS